MKNSQIPEAVKQLREGDVFVKYDSNGRSYLGMVILGIGKNGMFKLGQFTKNSPVEDIEEPANSESITYKKFAFMNDLLIIAQNFDKWGDVRLIKNRDPYYSKLCVIESD